MSVYFIQQGLDGPIKIGKADDVTGRLASLQSANPQLLHIRLILKGGLAREQEFHARFKSHRIWHEWFRPHDEIEDFIMSHPLEDRSYAWDSMRTSDLKRVFPKEFAELQEIREFGYMQWRARKAEREGRVIYCPASWD